MRRRWIRALCILLVSGLLAGLAACSRNSEAKQELASLKQQLATPGSGAQMSGSEEGIGTVEPTIAWVVGPPRTVTVQKASLIQLPGFRLPQLVGLGAVPGCAGSENIVASTNRKDQVQVVANGRQLRPLKVVGYRMRMGDAKCAPAFVYSVVSTAPGDYSVGGLRLTVQFGGQIQTVVAYSGIFVWYYAFGAIPSNSTYNRAWNAASSAEDQLFDASH